MSVLIKGMEMPKNCAYCPLSEYEYGRHAGLLREANLMSYEQAEKKIADRKRWEAKRARNEQIHCRYR